MPSYNLEVLRSAILELKSSKMTLVNYTLHMSWLFSITVFGCEKCWLYCRPPVRLCWWTPSDACCNTTIWWYGMVCLGMVWYSGRLSTSDACCNSTICSRDIRLCLHILIHAPPLLLASKGWILLFALNSKFPH